MGLIEKDVIVTTKHGRMPAFAACPDTEGTVPAIIFYMDAPGFRTELCNMARRIAKHGYYCLLPDMYYRLGTVRFDLPRRNDGMSGVIRAAMNHLTNADVVDDTSAMLAWLDAQAEVSPGKVGCEVIQPMENIAVDAKEVNPQLLQFRAAQMCVALGLSMRKEKEKRA